MIADEVSEGLEYKRGEIDGRTDGGKGVKPLGIEIQRRHYSASYQAGYKAGYDKASEPHRLRREGKI